MTIKDAVEYYNMINDKIQDVKNTMEPILSQDTGPLKVYHISPSDMAKITTYLNNYIKMLEDKLEEDFE